MTHQWEEIVKQIERERDPDKLAKLAQKLNAAMLAEEREKVKSRFAMLPDRPQT